MRDVPVTVRIRRPASRPSPEAIRPFTFSVSDEELPTCDAGSKRPGGPIAKRIRRKGSALDTIQALARYWATDYDWRTFEKRFAALPHFVNRIDGVDIHFIHVRSKHEDALPLIVTHGWPGSTIEQLKIIDPLTDPTGPAPARPMPSISSSRRCRATASPASRPRPAGTRSASLGPGSNS